LCSDKSSDFFQRIAGKSLEIRLKSRERVDRPSVSIR
jgi:hypothetical protein